LGCAVVPFSLSLSRRRSPRRPPRCCKPCFAPNKPRSALPVAGDARAVWFVSDGRAPVRSPDCPRRTWLGELVAAALASAPRCATSLLAPASAACRATTAHDDAASSSSSSGLDSSSGAPSSSSSSTARLREKGRHRYRDRSDSDSDSGSSSTSSSSTFKVSSSFPRPTDSLQISKLRR